MKIIINTAVFILSISLLSINAHAGLSIYRNEIADLAIFGLETNLSMATFGGSINMGSASTSDCFVMSDLNETDKSGDRILMGRLRPVHTDIVSYEIDDRNAETIKLITHDELVRIEDIDVFEVCGNGVDFSGTYTIVNKPSEDYKQAFDSILHLVHTNAIYMYRNGNVDKSISDLRPFVESINWSVSDKSNEQSIIASSVNDYAFFLQKKGLHREAINYFEKIITIFPNRIVTRLNIADSYWAIGEIDLAVKEYNNYVSMMDNSESNSNIPARVLERIEKRTIHHN